MEVKINREIRNYTESMFFGLSMRQFVFSALAILVAVGLYFLLKPHFGTETVSWMCILGAAPFAALGFITYHGMTAEQFLWEMCIRDSVYIKRQEFGHPIKIVESNGEYTRDDGSIGVSYNIKRVYDVSQTTARTRAPQAVSHDARALLNALIYKRPAPVQSVDELPNGMNAVYDREQNAVFVRRGLSVNDLFCGLSKALAQAELARTGEEYTEENAGFKAQCVSYILGKEFGVDVSGYAFEAPANFLRTDDPQTIRAELTDIRDTAYDISARMMRSLEQNKAPRQSEQER